MAEVGFKWTHFKKVFSPIWFDARISFHSYLVLTIKMFSLPFSPSYNSIGLYYILTAEVMLVCSKASILRRNSSTHSMSQHRAA
jgi:hypothetical protein